MSEKTLRGAGGSIEQRMRAPMSPGRLPASAKLFPGALLRKAQGAGEVAASAEDAVARASSSSGTPLPDEVRGRFESSLGADLSAVRVHVGADSADAAASVGARAYTTGNDVHFAAGQYAPLDPFGVHLLAHEVAHTQQQAGGTPHRQHKLEVGAPGDAHEVEADRAADAMVSGAPFALAGAGSGVQRKLDAPGANVTYGVEVGDHYSIDGGSNAKGGGEVGQTIKLWSGSFNQNVYGPLYLGASGSLAFVCSKEVASDGEKAEGTGMHGKLVVTGTGSVGLGAAKGESKIGVEGQLDISSTVDAVLGRDHLIEGNPVINFVAKVNLALVGQVNDKLKGSVKKQLAGLVIYQGVLSGNGIEPAPGWCGQEQIKQAAEDLLDNSAGMGLLGAPGVAFALYDQHKRDEAAQKEFDSYAPDGKMEPAEQEARSTEAYSSGAAPAVPVQDQYDNAIQLAKIEADRAAAPFNGQRDQSWWKNGAFAAYNQGTTHRMNAQQAFERFNAATGVTTVKQLADEVIDHYHQASASFYEAQREQFGAVQQAG